MILTVTIKQKKIQRLSNRLLYLGYFVDTRKEGEFEFSILAAAQEEELNMIQVKKETSTENRVIDRRNYWESVFESQQFFILNKETY